MPADIDLVVLVDDAIYRYRHSLFKFFDRVIHIKLWKLALTDKYIQSLRAPYTPQISALYHNKWQLFKKMQEYDKVLFTDVDIAPIDAQLYSVFDMETPAAMVNDYPHAQPRKPVLQPADWFMSRKPTLNALELRCSINGGLMLLRPRDGLDYEEFVASLQPYTSLPRSFPDETSLVLYWSVHQKRPVHVIPPHFSQPTWAFHRGMYSANFLSAVKPWLVPPKYTLDRIWHEAAAAAFKDTRTLKRVYRQHLANA
jgi:hypothetical protein